MLKLSGCRVQTPVKKTSVEKDMDDTEVSAKKKFLKQSLECRPSIQIRHFSTQTRTSKYGTSRQFIPQFDVTLPVTVSDKKPAKLELFFSFPLLFESELSAFQMVRGTNANSCNENTAQLNHTWITTDTVRVRDK